MMTHRIYVHIAELFQEPKVFLTVSSLAGYEDHGNDNSTLLDRKVVLNWYGLKRESNSFVALYDKDPNSLLAQVLKVSALYTTFFANNFSPQRDRV